MLADGRQRGRRGPGHRDHADARRAGVQRHRLGRLRHRLGRQAAARPECLGPLARGVDAGVLRRQRGSGARLELGDGAGRGVGLGRTACQVRQACRSSGSSSRRSATAATGSSSRRRSPRSGPAQVPELTGAAGLRRGVSAGRPRARAGGAVPVSRARGDAGEDRGDEGRGVLSRRARGERWRRIRRPTAAPCAPPTSPRTASTGSAPSPSTTAATRLHEIPPNGQGIVALIALGILEHFDMASLPVDSADSVHLQIEAMKLAFADALAYVADIDYMPVTPGQLLDKDYLKDRSQLIDRNQAKPVVGGVAPERRHRVPHRRRRLRNDGVDDPVELHGFRLGRGGAGHRDLAAEPRRELRRDARTPQPGGAATSVRITPSFPASSPRTAHR